MATATKITTGIIGILLLAGSGLYFLTPEQLDAASTCTTNNVTGIFSRFSSTNTTAYWTVNGTEKSSVCTKGKWIPTRQWLTNNNLKESDVTITPNIQEATITETGVDIIKIGDVIVVDKAKQISIAGTVYNVSYTPTIITKCICDRPTCDPRECLQ